MLYRIEWSDATECKQPGTIFPHYRLDDLGQSSDEWKDVIVWDFFESTPEKLKDDVKKYLEDSDRNIDIFDIRRKYGRKIIMTEEDL